MERTIKTNGFEVKTEAQDARCLTCPFLYGEMGQVLKALKLDPSDQPELTASASCHARDVRTRHINIVLNANGKIVNADEHIRNWISREVHCNK